MMKHLPTKYKKRYKQLLEINKKYFTVHCIDCNDEWKFGPFLFARCPRCNGKPNWKRREKDIREYSLKEIKEEMKEDEIKKLEEEIRSTILY